MVIAVQVGELRLRFSDGSQLVVNARLDADLGVVKNTFDLLDQTGVRRKGWHGHQEPNAGFHHLHMHGRRPEPAPEATFEAVRERLLNE